MKKLWNIYLEIFEVVALITSYLYISPLIYELNLPKGIISALVHYAYAIIHFGSFFAVLLKDRTKSQ